MKVSLDIGEQTRLRFTPTNRSLTKNRVFGGLFSIALILGFMAFPFAAGFWSGPKGGGWFLWLWYGLLGVSLVQAVRWTFRWQKLGPPDRSIAGNTTSFSMQPGDSVFVLDGLGPYDIQSYISIRATGGMRALALPTRLMARLVDADSGEQTEPQYKIHGGSNEPDEEVFPIPPGTRQSLAFWVKDKNHPATRKKATWRISIQLDAPTDASTWDLSLARLAREDADAFTTKR